MEFLLLLWKPVLSSAAVAIGAWLGRKFFKSNDDKNRAEIISRIADEALGLIILNNPGRGDLELVKMLVNKLTDALPTANTHVIVRAATAAVDRRANFRAVVR